MTKAVASDDRPGGTPPHWKATTTKRGGGTKYTNPDNPHDHVRDMPGDPNSPWPAQRRPYVKRMKDGRAYDAKGMPVNPKSPEAHIPRERFKFAE